MSGKDVEFDDFVVARRSRLWRTAYLLCGDPHRAEDIVQDALTRLYRAWSRASRADSIEAYARRAVVNAHLDDVRRPWSRRETTVEASRLDRAHTEADPAEADALWAAIRSLAPRQRRVVVLRHYWGLSVAETAADLGIAEGTVKSQTSDALAHLRVALAERQPKEAGR